MVERVTREYHSPLRAANAQATRAAIRSAAAELFVSTGYAATSVRAIADAAGVSAQTVYAQFGSKPAIVRELLDVSIVGDDEPVPVSERTWFTRVFDPGIDGRERLRRYAAACTRINAGAGDVFDIIRRGADADAELAELWNDSLQQRRRAVTGIVDAVVDDTRLRPGLDRAGAVDLLWTFHGPEMYRLIVRECGWDVENYERWLATTLCEQLLG